MSWDTLQQLLRIVLYAIGGWAFGDAVTSGADFQNAVTGLISVAAFVWWIFYQKNKPEGS